MSLSRKGHAPGTIQQLYRALNLEKVYEAVAYFLANRPEVDQYLKRQEQPLEQVRQHTAQIHRLQAGGDVRQHAGRDAALVQRREPPSGNDADLGRPRRPGRSPVSTHAHEAVVEGDGAAVSIVIVQVSPNGGRVAEHGAEVERQRPGVEDAAACAAIGAVAEHGAVVDRQRPVVVDAAACATAVGAVAEQVLRSIVTVPPRMLKMPPPTPPSAWLPDRVLCSIVTVPPT